MQKIYRLLNMPNMTIALIGAQVVAYLLVMQGALVAEAIDLRAAKVMDGEFWRLFTFVVLPPFSNPLCAFFAWMLFYIFGSSLEQFWGAGKYNTFLLSGYIITVLCAFIIPDQPFENMFVMTAVFLSFAFYNPDYELLLFFILPVKVKWFALLIWLGFVYLLAMGSGYDQLTVAAATANFFLFLGADVYRKMRGRKRKIHNAMREKREESIPFHTCASCGITDKTHPGMKFRYCHVCDGSLGYCEEHIGQHEHVHANSYSAAVAQEADAKESIEQSEQTREIPET